MVIDRVALFSLILAGLLSPVNGWAQNPLGEWQRGDGIANVKVAPCGKVICMTNIFIKPGVTDEKVGERLEFDVKASGDQALTGAVFDPKTGKSYSVVVEVAGDQMTTRGCILGGVICKTTNWTRIR